LSNVIQKIDNNLFIKLELEMSNTYSQLNIHLVFCVQGKENVLNKALRERLFPYISGTIKSKGHFSLAVNGFTDHVHIFFELSPKVAISDLVRDLKSSSSKWINDNKLIKGKFNWQTGYGAFSYSRSQRNTVIKYIMNQEEHHKGLTFKEEYLELLKKFEINFNEEYLFEFYD